MDVIEKKGGWKDVPTVLLPIGQIKRERGKDVSFSQQWKSGRNHIVLKKN